MSDSRSRILTSIRQSLQKARLPAAPSEALSISDRHSRSPAALADRFAAELRAVGGTFLATTAAEAPALVANLARERGAGRVLAWQAEQLPVPETLEALLDVGVVVTSGDLPRDAARARALADEAAITVGLTGADAALAETGTLALLAGPGRPRLAAMSVRTHIALVTPEQLYPSLAAWVASTPAAKDQLRERSALTLISGPSRTADIEMTLTVGVHGPGEVIVVLVSAT